MYLATFHYWINKSGTQGQGRQSPGQNSTDFNFFARVPRQCLGLFAEGAAGSSSVVLHLIVISLSVPCAFINLACSFSLHALTSTNCFMASFSLSFLLSNIICASFTVCMSPVLTAVESLPAASLIRRRWALSAPVTAFFLAVQLHGADLLNPLLFSCNFNVFSCLCVFLLACSFLLFALLLQVLLSEHDALHWSYRTLYNWNSSSSTVQSNGLKRHSGFT